VVFTPAKLAYSIIRAPKERQRALVNVSINPARSCWYLMFGCALCASRLLMVHESYLATLKKVNIEFRIIVKMGRVGWMCNTALSDILAMT